MIDPIVDLELYEDFEEFDALANPKPIPDADQPDQPNDVDDFDDLDALLDEAMEARAETSRVKAARAKAKSGFSNTPDDLERIRRWELANEWRSVANVALFHRFNCACGKHSTVFEGLMLEQVGRRNPDLHRWTAVEPTGRKGDEQPQNTASRLADELPKRTAIRVSKVPMCPVCLNGEGFSLAGGLEWEA